MSYISRTYSVETKPSLPCLKLENPAGAGSGALDFHRKHIYCPIPFL